MTTLYIFIAVILFLGGVIDTVRGIKYDRRLKYADKKFKLKCSNTTDIFFIAVSLFFVAVAVSEIIEYKGRLNDISNLCNLDLVPQKRDRMIDGYNKVILHNSVLLAIVSLNIINTVYRMIKYRFAYIDKEGIYCKSCFYPAGECKYNFDNTKGAVLEIYRKQYEKPVEKFQLEDNAEDLKQFMSENYEEKFHTANDLI